MALFGGFTRTDTDDSDDPLLALHLSYSIVKMEGANFWNAPSIDHLGDGMFCAIYRFPTHVVENNLSSSKLV